MLPVPDFLNPLPNRFSSCIKIAGLSILPPLITEERRKELNEDKTKAVEIEKRIKRKRSSIDSGVMTGSYIDSYKNSEVQQIENTSTHPLSLSDINQNKRKLKPSVFDATASDNFLKTALEDTEFREFFYSTAERIFKDNNIINNNKHQLQNNSLFFENNNEYSLAGKEHEETVLSETLSNVLTTEDLLELNVCNDINLVPSAAENEQTINFSVAVTSENIPKIRIEASSPIQKQLVRRNSYTLESPSPVLLEHMAKENQNNRQKYEKWNALSDKKEKSKGLGFKSFTSDRKTRKMWNKYEADNSHLKNPRFSFKRSKTFIKSNTKKDQLNNSLPCSSRSSPIHFSPLAHSSDSIQLAVDKFADSTESHSVLSFDSIPEQFKEEITPHQTDSMPFIIHKKKTTVVKKQYNDLEPTTQNMSNMPLLNNTSTSSHLNCDMDILLPPKYEPIIDNSINQISAAIQSTYIHQNMKWNRNLDNNKNVYINGDQSADMDENVSVCSSLSLSKFMPLDDNVSRPSTAEDVSVLFSELNLRHERQLAELLKKQHEEKVVYSKLHSNNETLSDKSITNLNIFDHPSEISFSQSLSSEKKRNSCSRELFPSQTPVTNSHTLNVSPKEGGQSQICEYSLDRKKDAAIKITAYIRGYLTRRLLKTEKVQQLKDVIKESLNCAFSLQSETELKKNDLELHERLAHQMNAAFDELQSVISAPVAKRMAIISLDRDRLKKPLSRPSSAISSATQKSLLRRQQSLTSAEKNVHRSRTRTKSLCLSGISGVSRSGSFIKSDSSSVTSSTSARKPWR